MKESTVQKMRALNLSGMASVLEADCQSQQINQYATLEYIDVLINAQWESRFNARTKKLKQQAKFRQSASLLDIDYDAQRGIKKNALLNLLQLDFMVHQQNIIITGATGTGKSFIAQCIGNKACDMHFKTKYITMVDLATEIELEQLKGSYAKWLKTLQDCHLLIIDDFGLTTITQGLKKALMEIIDYRYGRSSTIIAAQIPIDKWHQLINDDTIADALLDRIVHRSHKIELQGESMRRLKKI